MDVVFFYQVSGVLRISLEAPAYPRDLDVDYFLNLSLQNYTLSLSKIRLSAMCFRLIHYTSFVRLTEKFNFKYNPIQCPFPLFIDDL